MRDPTTSSTKKVTNFSKRRDFGPPSQQGNFKEEGKPQTESPVPILQHGQSHGYNILCLWCEASFAPSGFAYIQDLTQLEISPPKSRGSIYGQNRTRQCGKAKEHFQSAVTKGVNLEIPKREEVEVHHRMMRLPNRDETAKCGTTSRRRRTIRTIPSMNAQRQNEKHFGAATQNTH